MKGERDEDGKRDGEEMEDGREAVISGKHGRNKSRGEGENDSEKN